MRRSSCSALPAACSHCSSIPEATGRNNLFARSSRIHRIGWTTTAASGRPAAIAVAPVVPETGNAQGDAASVAPEPARPRLVHFLSRRCADRVRAVHRGLSDDAEMDPGRDRAGAVDRRRGRPDRADAGRRHRRCRPLRTAGGGPCRGDDRRQRAGLCGMADLSGRGRRGDPACRRELRARSGDRRDQPRAGRAACDRRAARTQRPLRVARQRRRRRRDGHLRLSSVEPLGVSRHLHAGDSDLARADRGSASTKSMSRRPMARSCARCPMPRPPAFST